MIKALFNKRFIIAYYESNGLSGLVDKVRRSDIIMTEDHFSDSVITAVNKNEMELLEELLRKEYEQEKKTGTISTS